MEVTRIPMAICQHEEDAGHPTWCSPFQGLFEQLKTTFLSGAMVSASTHRGGAASEEQTTEGLLSGHGKALGIPVSYLGVPEYAVIAAVLVDAEEGGGTPIVILSNPVRVTTATSGPFRY